MKREARDRRESAPAPVKRIELEDKPSRRRVILLIGALAIVAGALFFTLRAALRVDPGWGEIESEGKYAEEITLRYDLGRSGENPETERKKLQRIFTLALQQAGQALDSSESQPEPRNLAWVNAHPGEKTEVAPELYAALEKALEAGRWVFLGPVMEANASLLASMEDGEAAAMDPRKDPDMADFVRQAMAYLTNPEQIRVEMLGENQIRLVVSEEYLAFGEEYGIRRWIDFGWIKNAFVIDAVAEKMLEAGADRGILSSGDGFLRSLCENDGIQLAMRGGEENVTAVCAEAAAMICRTAEEAGRRYADGTIRTPWLSMTDGLDGAGVEGIIAAVQGNGCGVLALWLMPLLSGVEAEYQPSVAENVWILRHGMLQKLGSGNMF